MFKSLATLIFVFFISLNCFAKEQIIFKAETVKGGKEVTISSAEGMYFYNFGKPNEVKELSFPIFDLTDPNSAFYEWHKDSKTLYLNNRGQWYGIDQFEGKYTLIVFKGHPNDYKVMAKIKLKDIGIIDNIDTVNWSE